jgi:hypothetical protein
MKANTRDILIALALMIGTALIVLSCVGCTASPQPGSFPVTINLTIQRIQIGDANGPFIDINAAGTWTYNGGKLFAEAPTTRPAKEKP